MDRSARKKATAKNCYSKKEGLFLPQFGSLWEPSFKEEYKSSLTYTLYDDKTLWNDTVKNSHYAHEIFNYLTGQLQLPHTQHTSGKRRYPHVLT